MPNDKSSQTFTQLMQTIATLREKQQEIDGYQSDLQSLANYKRIYQPAALQLSKLNSDLAAFKSTAIMKMAHQIFHDVRDDLDRLFSNKPQLSIIQELCEKTEKKIGEAFTQDNWEDDFAEAMGKLENKVFKLAEDVDQKSWKGKAYIAAQKLMEKVDIDVLDEIDVYFFLAEVTKVFDESMNRYERITDEDALEKLQEEQKDQLIAITDVLMGFSILIMDRKEAQKIFKEECQKDHAQFIKTMHDKFLTYEQKIDSKLKTLPEEYEELVKQHEKEIAEYEQLVADMSNRRKKLESNDKVGQEKLDEARTNDILTRAELNLLKTSAAINRLEKQTEDIYPLDVIDKAVLIELSDSLDQMKIEIKTVSENLRSVNSSLKVFLLSSAKPFYIDELTEENEERFSEAQSILPLIYDRIDALEASLSKRGEALERAFDKYDAQLEKSISEFHKVEFVNEKKEIKQIADEVIEKIDENVSYLSQLKQVFKDLWERCKQIFSKLISKKKEKAASEEIPEEREVVEETKEIEERVEPEAPADTPEIAEREEEQPETKDEEIKEIEELLELSKEDPEKVRKLLKDKLFKKSVEKKQLEEKKEGVA